MVWHTHVNTRWATHGAPSKLNCHPHVDEEETFAVDHNGVITNYKALRQLLVSRHSIIRFLARDIRVYSTVHSRITASLQQLLWCFIVERLEHLVLIVCFSPQVLSVDFPDGS